MVRHKGLLVIAAAWALVTGTFFAYKPGTLLFASLLLSAVFFLAFPFAIGAIFLDWRSSRWYALVPFLSFVAAVPTAIGLGEVIGIIRFANNLPRYEAVVSRQDAQAVLFCIAGLIGNACGRTGSG